MSDRSKGKEARIRKGRHTGSAGWQRGYCKHYLCTVPKSQTGGANLIEK
jgi:hypothetical protein